MNKRELLSLIFEDVKDDKQRVLHSPFDIETHKSTFINYLEVIIDEEGVVHYAVPSHQEFVIRYLMNKLDISREELYDRCPREYYCDFMFWLCREANCIAVWNDRYEGTSNRAQQAQLRKLKINGLYRGPIKKLERVY